MYITRARTRCGRSLPRFAFLMTIQFASYKALCSSCPKAFLLCVCVLIYLLWSNEIREREKERMILISMQNFKGCITFSGKLLSLSFNKVFLWYFCTKKRNIFNHNNPFPFRYTMQLIHLTFRNQLEYLIPDGKANI